MRRYTLTFLALLALTSLTLLLSFLPLGPFAVPSALVIAAAKAVLIALWFMHLAEQGTVQWVTAAVSVLVLATLIALALLDVLSRGPAAAGTAPAGL